MSSNEEEAAWHLSYYFRMLGRKQQKEIYTCDDCRAKFYWDKRKERDILVECCADGNCCLKTVCPYGACWRTFEECGHSQYCCNEFPDDGFVIEVNVAATFPDLSIIIL